MLLSSQEYTPSSLKSAIVQRLEYTTPEEVYSAYSRTIEPWFSIIPVPVLQSMRPLTWDQTPVDLALLCLSIASLTSTPPSVPGHDRSQSELWSLYSCVKGAIALAEGLGINSYLLVQSRILVTLFEVAHGLYPAAYISIGATIRAADALDIHFGTDASTSRSLHDKTKREKTALIWCGILILDK